MPKVDLLGEEPPEPLGVTKSAEPAAPAKPTTAKKANGRRGSGGKKSNKSAPTNKPDKPELTATELARQKAGVDTAKLTDAERAQRRLDRQRERRSNMSPIQVWLTVDQKVELLAASQANGRTMKDEMLARLFGEG